HRELDRPEFHDQEYLEQCLAEGADLFGRDMHYRFVPLDESFPKYLLENRERFRTLIGKEHPSAGQLYREAVATASDINEHVEYLYRLASTVAHVTEVGTRFGEATIAFLYAAPKRLVVCNHDRRDLLPTLESAAQEMRVEMCVLTPA